MKCRNEAMDVLRALGIAPNYIGYFQTVDAVALCAEAPERLTQITKQVYMEVGKRYGVKWTAVERNIRTVARIAWERSRAFRGDGWLCFSERIRLPSACCSRCTRALLPTDSTASPCSKRQRFSGMLTMDFFFSLPPLALFALFLCVSMLTNTSP